MLKPIWGIVCFLWLFMLAWHPVFAEMEHIEVDVQLTEDEIVFTYFDLSNGESTLIQSGKGETVLVDTGDAIARDELLQRLNMFDVQKIDRLVLTSAKAECIGNTNWLLEHYPVNKVIVPNVVKDELQERLSLEDYEVEGWTVGKQEEVMSGLETEVLYMEERPGENIGSLAVSFTFGEQRTLYMDVADVQIEEQLVQAFPLKSAILKVADFGSPNGTSQPFLEKVDPQVAVLFKKRGAVPSSFVLERLQETWIDIYQTNHMGTISIKCSRDDYEIMTVRVNEEEITSFTTK